MQLIINLLGERRTMAEQDNEPTSHTYSGTAAELTEQLREWISDLDLLDVLEDAEQDEDDPDITRAISEYYDYAAHQDVEALTAWFNGRRPTKYNAVFTN